MKTYLFIYDVEAGSHELIMKVKPIYCADDKTSFLPVNDKDYIPTKGDKLYFLPGVNIPRVKLKDLSLEFGIKSIRDIDQATHVFCGKNTKDKLVTSHWYYELDTQLLRDIVDNADEAMDDFYTENLRQALEFYTEPIVIVDYSSASNLRNSNLGVLRNITGPILRNSTVYYTVEETYKDLFPGIMSLDLYNESKLLKHINGADAATIDETMFQQISDMFNSSDSDNHILAMEIMANCNYMDSLIYIEMLFEKYAGHMTNSHTKNHVNFKSLVSFLGKDRTYLGTNIDDIVKSLINKDVFDIEKVNIIMKHYGQEIAAMGGTEFFEVKSVTLNEEAAKLLNTNYVHETFPDFIPENVMEEEVDLNSIPEVAEVTSEVELSDEDIQDVLDSIETNTAEEEALALEDATFFSESELNETEKGPEEQSNNNQIEEDNGGDGFEWF